MSHTSQFVEQPSSIHYLRWCMRRKRNPKTRACPSLGIAWQLNEFCPFPSQTITTYNSHSMVSECTLLLPNESITTWYSFHKKCDTFSRTTTGRTWLAEVVSQDHTHYTQLLWTSTIKIHIIDSQPFELSKIKSIALAETHLLLESNPL